MDTAPDTGSVPGSVRLLEIGLCALLILAPLPFGAVGPGGRFSLELGALALVVLWGFGASRLPGATPGMTVRVALVGLLGLALLQALPLGQAAVSTLSPGSVAIRSDSLATAETIESESRLLGADARSFETAATLSVDPGATASALRTGAMMAALLLVATGVSALRGLRGIALALLVSASLQGLYGLVVLASRNPHIWYRAKEHYLDSATGTFINRNHFACLLAMSLACGLAMILADAARSSRGGSTRLWVRWFGGDNSRNLVFGLLLIVGLAGLLASLSRAGITLGLLALCVTTLAAGRIKRWRLRVAAALVVLTAAVLPLVQISMDRLAERYASSAGDLVAPGGRARVWLDSLELIGDFPIFGTGFGTFASAYPLARSAEVRKFFAHAHNDVIQAGVEGGAIGLALLLLLLIPLSRRIWNAVTGRYGTLAVGFAAGSVAVLLHALVDFNFHIPANAATAAVLAGGLFGCRLRTSRR